MRQVIFLPMNLYIQCSQADCFGTCKNPYVPLEDDNPSLAQIRQRTLKGPGAEERKAVINRSQSVWDDLLHGRDYDKNQLLEFYSYMAQDIAKEKKRIGGDFAIASVLINREVRSQVKKILGPQLVIISLTMPYTEKRARVLKRHDGDVSSADMMDVSNQVSVISHLHFYY